MTMLPTWTAQRGVDSSHHVRQHDQAGGERHAVLEGGPDHRDHEQHQRRPVPEADELQRVAGQPDQHGRADQECRSGPDPPGQLAGWRQGIDAGEQGEQRRQECDKACPVAQPQLHPGYGRFVHGLVARHDGDQDAQRCAGAGRDRGQPDQSGEAADVRLAVRQSEALDQVRHAHHFEHGADGHHASHPGTAELQVRDWQVEQNDQWEQVPAVPHQECRADGYRRKPERNAVTMLQ
jgi:hypothetical protein